MSDCNFDLNIKDTAAAFLAKAQGLSKKMNGSFDGDTASGTFNIPTPFGKLIGTYVTEGLVVHITVTDKPMLMACGVIESLLKGYLE
ncbi:MAG: hypothetical protein P4L41_03695 [Flavipsychrobacter sp.]|nr:hypothetical protein [Flavipsychrobacter sp.]